MFWNKFSQRYDLVAIGGTCDDNLSKVDELRPGCKHRTADLMQRKPGAGATNVAIGVHQLGRQRVMLLANTGNDEAGHWLRDQFKNRGLFFPLPPIDTAATSKSYIIADQQGTNTIVSDPGVRSYPIPIKALQRFVPQARACSIVAHDRCEQIPLVLKLAKEHHLWTSLAVNRAQIALGAERLGQLIRSGGGVNLLTLNRHEAHELTGVDDLGVQLETLSYGGTVETVVITCDTDGIAARCGRRCESVPAFRNGNAPIVDATGGGDAAHAALIDAFMRGDTLEQSLRCATRNAFHACSQIGFASLDAEAMHAYLAESEPSVP